MRNSAQRAWLPWVSIGLLAALCAILAFLQYQWTGEISRAERSRLQEQLQTRLAASGRTFTDDIASALRSLYPSESQISQEGVDAAWKAQYLAWKANHGPLLAEAGIEFRTDDGYRFLKLDLSSGALAPAERLDDRDSGFLELPGAPGVPEHLLVHLNLKYIRDAMAPEILRPNLSDYEIEVVTAIRPPVLIYSSQAGNGTVWDTADASTPLLDMRFAGPGGRPGRFGGGQPFGRGPGGGPPPFGFGRGPGPGSEPGRWRLMARHKSGSLEALVARTQRRNLAVSGAVILLILGTVAMLIRYSRQAQRLADLQMNFVAGVSHELRTPLTVIRTAAYNLRNPAFRRNEVQVERYGRMIEAESGKLDGLVEQVLSFAGAQAGHAVRTRERIDVAELIEDEVRNMRGAAESRGVEIEQMIDPGPLDVNGDATALRHAFRNLLDNALKHATAEAKWIGVSAACAGRWVEIRVADRGPGIPASERRRIFDPFVRGARALTDQVHGTGLGLNLVKKIVEAHSGTVDAASRAEGGAEFIVRIPAAEGVAA